MPDVRPFRAVRYARPGVELVAPPYDVIDEETGAGLRGRSPWNVARSATRLSPVKSRMSSPTAFAGQKPMTASGLNQRSSTIRRSISCASS